MLLTWLSTHNLTGHAEELKESVVPNSDLAIRHSEAPLRLPGSDTEASTRRWTSFSSSSASLQSRFSSALSSSDEYLLRHSFVIEERTAEATSSVVRFLRDRT